MKNIYYSLIAILSIFIIVSCSTENTPIYQLSTTVEPSAAGTVTPSSKEYNEGDQVEITATPNEHWVFNSWSGSLTGSANPANFTMDSDKSITAMFVKRNYPLTVNTEGEGVVSERVVQVKTTDYPHGTIVELTANPADGWGFVEWNGDLVSSNNPESIVISGDKIIVAVFTNLTFSGGNGSEENPYQVSDFGQLQLVNDYVDSHFIQISDIDGSSSSGMNSGKGFKPIGSPDTPFSGTFNGNGYEISGLVINRIDEDYVGMFGYADSARLQNIKLINSSVYGKNFVGGLIGFSNLTHISDSNSSTFVYGDNSSAGGLVGKSEKGTVSNSFSNSTVSGNLFVGGLIGTNQGIVDDSYATGNVTGGNYVGGLVGSNSVYAEIYDSHSQGDVSGNNFIGGFVGSNSQSEIKRSFATGGVNGDSRVGGFAGYNLINGLITESYANGDVIGVVQVGGLVGLSTQSQIIDSYSIGNISGDNKVGGLIGENSSTVKRTYAVGHVNGNVDVGGIIGVNGATIEFGYWNTETTGEPNATGSGSSVGATGLITTQMTSISAEENMPEFDWNEIWITTESYPILRWQQE